MTEIPMTSDTLYTNTATYTMHLVLFVWDFGGGFQCLHRELMHEALLTKIPHMKWQSGFYVALLNHRRRRRYCKHGSKTTYMNHEVNFGSRNIFAHALSEVTHDWKAELSI